MASKEWGSVAGGAFLVNSSHIVEHAQTGDIVLFQGSGIGSKIIRWLSASTEWSHVGIVVEDKSQKPSVKYITEVYGQVIDADPFHDGAKHAGVQVVDLRRRLETYHSHKVAWRPLRGAEVNEAKVQRFLKWYRDLELSEIPQYNYDVFDFIQYGTSNDQDRNVRANTKFYVCTAWAAEVLMSLGVIYSDRKLPPARDPRPPGGTEHSTCGAPIPGNYKLTDFGLTYYVLPSVIGKFFYQEIYYLDPKTRSNSSGSSSSSWTNDTGLMV